MSNHEVIQMETNERQMHEAILRDVRLRQRLEQLNKGYNLLNIDPQKRPYRIEVTLHVTLDLREHTEELKVHHKLPFSSGWEDLEEDDFEDFLRELSEWVKRPLCKPRSFNRKDTTCGYYGYESIHYRRTTLHMSDVAIIVHSVAREYLERRYGIADFGKVVAELLPSQRDATRKEAKAIDRWVYLEERKLHLEEAVRHKTQLGISADEHDDKLKAIENEMRKLARKHEFLDIEGVSFHYLKRRRRED